ncbi:MAG TPA: chloride channel protein [Trebonia sp.]
MAERAGRVREPSPLIPWRLPSGRGATEQPNATGDGDAPLTPRFWVMLVITGVVTGLFADLMMLLLFTVQDLAYGYRTGGSFEEAVRHSGDLRRLAALLAAGVFGGIAWYLLRRFMPGAKTDLDDIVWRPGEKLSFRRSFLTGLISEVVVGLGASLGRENAPKLMGGASASLLSGWAKLTPGQKRLLMACGAGAGFGAVYNVPLAGALFTAEVMLGTISLPVILPALACAGIATVTSWLYLPSHITYPGIPDYRLTLPLVIFSLIAGPLTGLIASGYIRLIGWVTYFQLTGWKSVAAQVGVMGILGVIGFGFPQLFGNGQDLAVDAFAGAGGFAVLIGLFLLKPLVTAACLGSGASGGLFTPTLATGAALGAAAGIAWSAAWPGSPVGAYALVGAAAMMGAAMQAPLAALAMIQELTGEGYALMIPLIAATVLATIVARNIDGYSIYTARLRAAPAPPGTVNA